MFVSLLVHFCNNGDVTKKSRVFQRNRVTVHNDTKRKQSFVFTLRPQNSKMQNRKTPAFLSFTGYLEVLNIYSYKITFGNTVNNKD